MRYLGLEQSSFQEFNFGAVRFLSFHRGYRKRDNIGERVLFKDSSWVLRKYF